MSYLRHMLKFEKASGSTSHRIGGCRSEDSRKEVVRHVAFPV